jgi:hypothetical protein
MKQPARDLLSRLENVSLSLDQLDKALHAMLQEPLPASVTVASRTADRAKVSLRCHYSRLHDELVMYDRT